MGRIRLLLFFALLLSFLFITTIHAEDPTEPTETGTETTETGTEPEPTNEEGGEGEESELLQRNTSILIILTVLVVFSIAFEIGRDKIEEGTDKIMRPIVGSLWKELTVLGFLSLLSFLAVRSTLLVTISKAVFGEKKEEELVELMEGVHMGLFFIMMVFLVSVLILVRFGTRSERKWREAEKVAKSPEEAYALYSKLSQERHRNGHNFIKDWFGIGAEGRYKQAAFHIEYIALRDAFINPSDPLAPKLHPDFDFSEYLAYNLSHTLSNIIEIHPFTWMFLELVFVVVWGAQLLPQHWAVNLIELGLIYGILIFAISLRFKLDRTKAELIVPFDPNNSTFSKSPVASPGVSPVVPGNAHGNVQVEDYPNDSRGEIVVLLEQDAAKVGQRKAPYQLREIEPRGPLGKIFLGTPGNKHETLFWLDKKGPKFYLHAVRSMLLFMAFFVAFYSATVIIYATSEFTWYYMIELLAGGIPVIILGYFLLPQIIRRHVICCNIEMLKKKKTITKVIGLQKTKKTVRALKMVHSLRRHVGAEVGEKRKKPKKEGKKPKPKALDKHQIAEFRKIFDLFDTDKSGAISTEEFKAFMNALGQHITTVEAQAMIGEMEVNSDGELSFQEFCQFMEGQASTQEIEPEELAKKMFHVFDKDKSGTITTEEFLHVMEKMGETLSREDVEDIVLELDKDGDGEIDEEEFLAFVKKHI